MEVNTLLENLVRVLRQEEALFGETLLVEPSVPPSAEPVVPTKKHTVPEEPLLFDLPAVAGPVPSPADQAMTQEPWGGAQSLDELNSLTCNCVKCPLGNTRTNFVFGVGHPAATLMCIGEAPGADEDAQGEPFVGRAGQLLNKILEAINFKRSDVYICNILKCRPPNNRKPAPEEVNQCIPYLKKQIALVKPRVILCLGLTAAENLLNTRESMARLRGRVLQCESVPVMVTYHPAALLRNPAWKRPVWEDVQALRKLHDELAGKN